MIDHAQLTRENFDQWLYGLKSRRVFNFGSSTRCLIAEFCHDTEAVTNCETYLEDFWHQPPGTAGVAVRFPKWLLEISQMIRQKNQQYFTVCEFREWLMELDEKEPVTA